MNGSFLAVKMGQKVVFSHRRANGRPVGEDTTRRRILRDEELGVVCARVSVELVRGGEKFLRAFALVYVVPTPVNIGMTS